MRHALAGFAPENEDSKRRFRPLSGPETRERMLVDIANLDPIVGSENAAAGRIYRDTPYLRDRAGRHGAICAHQRRDDSRWGDLAYRREACVGHDRITFLIDGDSSAPALRVSGARTVFHSWRIATDPQGFDGLACDDRYPANTRHPEYRMRRRRRDVEVACRIEIQAPRILEGRPIEERAAGRRSRRDSPYLEVASLCL